jgi:hypothetical protein
MYPLFQKIINANVGKGRYFMALLGLAMGVLLILAAVQLNQNFNKLLKGDSKAANSNDFLVVSKKVTPEMMALDKDAAGFNSKELDIFKTQPFTKSIGILKTSQFEIYAKLDWNIKGATDMFFEAVSDKYLDIVPDKFVWDSTKNEIPVMVYAGLLDQYTTFALTRSDLPIISPETVTKIPLKITVGIAPNQVEFSGRIVGFTDRIQSFLVPESFMDWANIKYGNRAAQNPNRLILETADASDEKLGRYLETKDYVTNRDKTRFGKYKQIVNWAVRTISVIGFVLMLFALIIFGLFIQLVVSHARHDIQLLTTLGTAPKQLRGFLLKKFIPAMILVVLIGTAVVWVLQFIVSGFVKRLFVSLPNHLSVITLLCALAIMVILFLLNYTSINKAIKTTNNT